ncbi:ankyrin repeat domain-containing protein SOWAHB [Neoarius graeffei]|uniref:ankyrin repeat domain-containing protein SOWAHB n=1 Tax=Neoarius graeffei TaxID=443677 RepID=UPI00298C15EF|nr:ankyrin repeat domain-containing protein SOWAHB [Neoarius graeffei]
MGDVSEASLLDYICSSGGKVRNSDLLKTYKQFVSHSDLHLRAKYREDFKLIIDRIAVCKSENGEKYLILKKKYRQLMQERESEPAASKQGMKKKNNQDEWCVGPTITVTDAQDPDEREDFVTVENPEPLSEENPEPIEADDDLEKDSGSKSESEQEEESTGSVGSASVALDPIEKEWIYSAACGRLSHLTQLLKQDASLANKKDFTSVSSFGLFQQLDFACEHNCLVITSFFSFPFFLIFSSACFFCRPQVQTTCTHPLSLPFISVSLSLCVFPSCPVYHDPSLSSWTNSSMLQFTALHWAAKHGKEDMVTVMADAGADVNTKAGYTPLHIAALHGHVYIFNLLIQTYGAKENVRDYSGHLASHYLNIQKAEESSDLNAGYHSPAQVTERRNRKLTSLFHSRKKWGSAEDLAPVPEERSASHQLIVPAFRPRKFSR